MGVGIAAIQDCDPASDAGQAAMIVNRITNSCSINSEKLNYQYEISVCCFVVTACQNNVCPKIAGS
jgi:hypothetical protein